MIEVFHPSVFICEEMRARGWSTRDLAVRMGGDAKEIAAHELAFDLYLTCGPSNEGLRLGDDGIRNLARAFGTSAGYWKKLELAWLAAQNEIAAEGRAGK